MRIKFVKWGNNSPGSLVVTDDDGKEIFTLKDVKTFKTVHGSDGTFMQLTFGAHIPVELEVHQ